MAFGFRSPVTVNNGQVPSPQTDFPMLISVTDTRFKTTGNGGHVQNASGFDIRPYTDSTLTTAIAGYELERYNASTGEVIMWVKRSSLQNGTVTYLGYGDASITTDGSSTATWSNSFLGVYHYADGTTLNLNSSTGSNNGTNHSTTATSGQIDGAAAFASVSSQYVDLGTGVGDTALTYTAWVNGTSFPAAYQGVICRYGTAAGTQYTLLTVKSTGKLGCFCFTATSGNVAYDGTGTNTLSVSTWYYLALSYNSTVGLVGYVNASSDGTVAASGALGTNGYNTYVGNSPQTPQLWNGSIDEARISNVVRSQDWITTEYNNQFAPGTFETLGAEANLSPITGLYTK